MAPELNNKILLLKTDKFKHHEKSPNDNMSHPPAFKGQSKNPRIE